MPSKSRAQQRFMGMVHAVQQNKVADATRSVVESALGKIYSSNIYRTAIERSASPKTIDSIIKVMDTLKNRLRKKKTT